MCKQYLLVTALLVCSIALGQVKIYCSTQTDQFTEVSGAYQTKTSAHESGHFGFETIGPVRVRVEPGTEIGANQTRYWKGTIQPTELPEPGTTVAATIETFATTYYRLRGKHSGTDTLDNAVYTYLQSSMCTETAVHNCGGWHTTVKKITTSALNLEVVSIEVGLPPITYCDSGLVHPQLNALFPLGTGTLHWTLPWGSHLGAVPPAQPYLPIYHNAIITVTLDVAGVQYSATSRINGYPCTCDCTVPQPPTACLTYCSTQQTSTPNLEEEVGDK